MPRYIYEKGNAHMHISVWKSLIFLQASRQKNKKKEGRKWLAGGFYKKFPLLQKKHAKTSLFYKIHAKTSLFYKKVQKNPKKLPSFTKKLPSFTKKTSLFYKKPKKTKLPSFTKNQKNQKTKMFWRI
jgi:hypothetical protein